MPGADASELARDFALMEATVRDAGTLGLSMFRTNVRQWIKGESSPVSDADIALNDLIEQRLRSATPDYGWLSEESLDGDARLGKQLTWIIDPIDGTRSYLAGREDWCVCVALVEDHRPIMAAVYAPSTDEFFLARQGQGTTCNGRPVQATSGTDLDFTRIAGPKPLVERLPHPEELVLHPRIGSLALRLCWIANGRLDAGFAGGQSKDWDLAAADLIVHEANGRMSELSGDPILYNRREVTHGLLVAAGADRHAHIVEQFRTNRA